jgi:antitoxin (DNA-binding transcriptional repressor) of toxin-antitoxin stability system
MTTVTVREFSYNPSAMFARAEKGETIEVTRHGKVIATLVPGQRQHSRYDELVASGVIKPSGKTSADVDTFTHIDLPDDVDPLQRLLDDRYNEADWEREFREEREREQEAKG